MVAWIIGLSAQTPTPVVPSSAPGASSGVLEQFRNKGAANPATKIVANGPIALALALESVDHAGDVATDDALVLESNLFGLLASTSDMREGMTAFLEKRKAEFRNK